MGTLCLGIMLAVTFSALPQGDLKQVLIPINLKVLVLKVD